MTFTLTKERKYILIGGVILLFFGLIYKVYPIFQGLTDGSAQIAVKQKQLAKYQEAIEEGKELQKRLAVLNGSLEQGEAGLLRGKTPSLAAVDLQNILSTITQKSGVDIQSVRILKPTKQEGSPYLDIPVRFSLSLTTRQMKEILYGIALSERYLTVQEIRINAPRRKGRDQLRVDLTVDGFMKE